MHRIRARSRYAHIRVVFILRAYTSYELVIYIYIYNTLVILYVHTSLEYYA